MPRPDLVFVVDVPLEVCRERLDRSGWPARIAAQAAEVRNAYLEAVSDIVRLTTEMLGAVGVAVERIDGTAPVDAGRIQALRSLSV